MNVGKLQRLFGQIPGFARARVAPRSHITEVVVVALRLAVRRLVLLAKVPAARFVALQGVDAQQLAQFEKIRDAPCPLEALIQIVARACDIQVLPELLAEGSDFADGILQACGVARHAAVVPHDLAQFAMEGVDGSLAPDREQLRNASLRGVESGLRFGMRRSYFAQLR